MVNLQFYENTQPTRSSHILGPFAFVRITGTAAVGPVGFSPEVVEARMMDDGRWRCLENGLLYRAMAIVEER
jgi:hypothetical protein